MQTVEFNKPQVIKYLAYTFGIAYIIQIAVAMLYRNGGGAIGQMIMAAMMFVPLICVKLSGGKAEGMVWKRLQIRRNYKTILLAWFLPAILTAIGTALYFLVFPGHFDLTGAYLADNGGQAALDQLAAQGISYRTYILSSILACVTASSIRN